MENKLSIPTYLGTKLPKFVAKNDFLLLESGLFFDWEDS